MLVANGIPPNQKTNAWMTAVEQYLRFLSLAGTAAFATNESLTCNLPSISCTSPRNAALNPAKPQEIVVSFGSSVSR
jgi:hypothetical protein